MAHEASRSANLAPPTTESRATHLAATTVREKDRLVTGESFAIIASLMNDLTCNVDDLVETRSQSAYGEQSA